MSSFKQDCINKYGQKALQVYNKTQKSITNHRELKQAASPTSNYIIKKSTSKKKLKQSQSKSQLKSNSQTHFQKGANFNNSNKTDTLRIQNNGFTHTFNTLHNPKKQSLVITAINSPKQCSPLKDKQIRKSFEKKIQKKVQGKIEQILKNSKNGCDMLNGISQCLDYLITENNFKKSFQVIKQIIGSVIKQIKELYRKLKQQNVKIQQYQQQLNRQKSTSDSNSKIDHFKITIKNLQQQVNYYKNKQFAFLNAMDQFRVAAGSFNNFNGKHSKRHSEYLPNIANSSNQKDKQGFQNKKKYMDQVQFVDDSANNTNGYNTREVQNLNSFGKTERQSQDEEDSGQFIGSKTGPFYKTHNLS